MSIITQPIYNTDCSEISITTRYNIGDWILDSNEQFRVIISDKAEDSGGLLCCFVESIREFVTSGGGQYICIDANGLIGSTLSRRLYSIMVEVLANRDYRVQLPAILRQDSHNNTPFIDRAIVWQRLCDLILEDDTPQRLSVLVIENIELADQNTQHELARLIRLHKNNRINRLFFLTLNNGNTEQLLPELRELIYSSCFEIPAAEHASATT
ncbi:MAG: hypothetical protein LBJ00_10800 [Planctomycetaceae bacterium]|jgi:hypothetical protein|nr:hypothetical protein [Planctomycetaceae bacterium]